MIKNFTIVFLTVISLVVNASAIAEDLPKELHFIVKKFEVLGDNPLSEAETQDVFEFFLGDHYGLEGIQAAATAFEQKLQQKGLAFFQVNLAPQNSKKALSSFS